MIAVCVENKSRLLADHQQSRTAFYEGAYPLTIGRVYSVVGMSITERAFYFLVRDDHWMPKFAHAGFFDLFTAEVPSGWRFALQAGINASGRDLWVNPGVAMWGYPELVDDPQHVIDLLEDEPPALAIFHAYVDAAEELDSLRGERLEE